jgi:hypothetical protein
LPEKTRVVLSRQESPVAVKKLGSGGIDVYPAVLLDIECALDVQHIQRVIPAERDRARVFPASGTLLSLPASSESGAKLSKRNRSISRCDMSPRSAFRAM